MPTRTWNFCPLDHNACRPFLCQKMTWNLCQRSRIRLFRCCDSICPSPCHMWAGATLMAYEMPLDWPTAHLMARLRVCKKEAKRERRWEPNWEYHWAYHWEWNWELHWAQNSVPTRGSKTVCTAGCCTTRDEDRSGWSCSTKRQSPNQDCGNSCGLQDRRWESLLEYECGSEEIVRSTFGRSAQTW